MNARIIFRRLTCLGTQAICCNSARVSSLCGTLKFRWLEKSGCKQKSLGAMTHCKFISSPSKSALYGEVLTELPGLCKFENQMVLRMTYTERLSRKAIQM